MLRRLQLRDVGPAAAIDLELAPRLNLLTGDNGLGKTFLLDVAWWALTRTWVGLPAWASPYEDGKPRIAFDLEIRGNDLEEPFESTYRFEAQDWSTPKRRLPLGGLVAYARADGGFSVWDSVRNAPMHNSRGRSPVAFHFTRDELWDGLYDSNRVVCNGLIRDWVSWQRAGETAFAELCRVLEGLSPSASEKLRPGPPMRVLLEDARDIPTLEMPYGTVPLTHAAAGVTRCASLAYLLVWAWHEHHQTARLLKQEPANRLVLIIDELEAHLHPQWQRAILPSVLEVVAELTRLDRAAVQMLAATHSPLVLASVEPLFDEAEDRVVLCDLDGDHVKVAAVPWAKQGDVVGWLTSEVFGLRQARSREAKRPRRGCGTIGRISPRVSNPNKRFTRNWFGCCRGTIRSGHDGSSALRKRRDPFPAGTRTARLRRQGPTAGPRLAGRQPPAETATGLLDAVRQPYPKTCGQPLLTAR